MRVGFRRISLAMAQRSRTQQHDLKRPISAAEIEELFEVSS
jgi:hypothetical protein